MSHTLSNALAPGFIRQTYEGTRNPHHQIIPINFADPPTPGVAPMLLNSGGTPVLWSTGLSLYLTSAMQPNLADDVKIGAADIYAVDPVTGVRTFIYTFQTGLIGTNTNATVPFTEAVWVFKTSAGKPLKVYIMESVYGPDQRNVGVVPADHRQDVIDYIESSDNIFYGRRDAWPLAFQTFTTKINDVLRRNGGFTDV